MDHESTRRPRLHVGYIHHLLCVGLLHELARLLKKSCMVINYYIMIDITKPTGLRPRAKLFTADAARHSQSSRVIYGSAQPMTGNETVGCLAVTLCVASFF